MAVSRTRRKFDAGWLATSARLPYPRFACIVAGLLVLTAATVSAQPLADRVTAGARIRIRAPDAGIPWRTPGVLDSLVRDTLYVGDLHEPPSVRGMKFAVPSRSVEHLEVSTGRASRWSHAGHGALWGLAIYGVLAGAYIVHEKATCHGSDCFGEGLAWIGLVGGIPWAAGTGAAVGYALPVEHWRAVQLGAP